MASTSKALVVRRLYRSLLKVAKPFDGSSSRATALTCLIHRTGMEDVRWEVFLRKSDTVEHEDPIPSHRLFRKLLREVVTGSNTGIRQMQFPSQVDRSSSQISELIRREFKCPADKANAASTKQEDNGREPLSASFTLETRREVAFMALRELNEKLAWAERLRAKAPKPHPQQAARFVARLPLVPSAYLQPGTYLVAHPNLTDYFRRAVICILDHQDEDNPRRSSSFHGTYGLIVNRICLSPQSGRNLTLEEILQPLPSDIASAFGTSLVKEGGPVHMSIQMVYASNEHDESNQIGGAVLPMIPGNQDESTALHSDRAIYYRGDIMKATNAVMMGRLDREDVAFFVGASCWSPGQLESEIERGFWLPCRGPPEIALSGICEHEPTEKEKPRPEADLWLSMLSACGDEEAQLAHLVWSDDGEDDCGGPCDDFS